MAFKKNNGLAVNQKRGDGGFKTSRIYDSPMFGKTNGIYADLATKTDAETFITGLEPLTDSVVTSYSGPMGRYYDDEKVVPADTTGDAKARTFTISFDNSNDKASVVIYNVLNTKIEDVALLLKGLSWKDSAGTALTGVTVDVKQSF